VSRSLTLTTLAALAGAVLLAGAAPVGKDLDPAQAFLPPAPGGAAWRLVWHDEFTGDNVDESKWERIGDSRRRDHWWLKDDAYLDGQGRLVLRTSKTGDRYGSGAVRSQGKFEHRFGYWECRVQFGKKAGHWPAFWLFSRPGVGRVGDEGRDGTEIDIMEKPWLTDHINAALHWDGYGKDHKSAAKKVEVQGISEGWHTFGLLWTSEEYVFYADGKEIWRTRAGGVSQVPAFVKLTDEIGSWGGDIAKADLPDHCLFDYVRVYDWGGEGAK
jgi:beta-glucanase (GH16 family)